MTLQEIKDQVLAGIDISPDQAAWLANMADSEALYAAAHEITVACFARVRHVFHHQRQVRRMSGKLQMVCTNPPNYQTKAEIYDLLPAEECLRRNLIQRSPGRQSILPRYQRTKTISQTDYPTLRYSPLYASTFVDSTLCFSGTAQ